MEPATGVAWLVSLFALLAREETIQIPTTLPIAGV